MLSAWARTARQNDDVSLFPQAKVPIMGITARVFLRSTLLLSFLAGPLASGAVASSITVDYSGTVVSASAAMTTATGVVAGDTIGGGSSSMFSYNPSELGSGGVYTFTGSNPASNAHNFAVTIYNSLGQQQFADSYTGDYASGSPDYFVIKMTAASGNTPAEMTIMGDTTYKAGAGYEYPANVPYTLVLQSTTYTGGTALPTATTMADFNTTNAQLTWDPDGLAFTATVNITTISFNPDFGVPEPTSLVMGVIAMVACTTGFLVVGRKRARAH